MPRWTPTTKTKTLGRRGPRRRKKSRRRTGPGLQRRRPGGTCTPRRSLHSKRGMLKRAPRKRGSTFRRTRQKSRKTGSLKRKRKRKRKRERKRERRRKRERKTKRKRKMTS